jgi:hypothetical protein
VGATGLFTAEGVGAVADSEVFVELSLAPLIVLAGVASGDGEV